jgi:hypothetical protein
MAAMRNMVDVLVIIVFDGLVMSTVLRLIRIGRLAILLMAAIRHRQYLLPLNVTQHCRPMIDGSGALIIHCELDLSPDRNGLIPARYAARYKQLGDFIRSCYGTSIIPSSIINGTLPGVYILNFDYPVTIDRISLMEDQTNGQVIRSYYVAGKVVDADADNGGIGPGSSDWIPLSKGTSIGHKKIDIFSTPVTVTSVKVSTTYVDIPIFRSITFHLCDQLQSSAVNGNGNGKSKSMAMRE